MFTGKKDKSTHTRKINPKLGLLGFLGFLGFSGFLPKILNLQDSITVPIFFFFFSFFGFFSFYYEGKMSDTLIDERFESNSYRASAIANKVALILILGISIFTMSILGISNSYNMLSILIATIGFSFGVSVFLQQYLLYQFENEE